jgi:hypothetical protein
MIFSNNNCNYFLKSVILIYLIIQLLVLIFIQSKFLHKYFDKISFLNNSNNLNLSESLIKDDPLNEYRLLHKSIIQLKKFPIKVSINGYTAEGYANKMYSVITSLVIAILTDSAIVIRWNNIDKFIEEPAYLAFKNYDLEMNELSANYKTEEIFVPRPVYGWKIEKDMNALIKTKLPDNKNRFIYNQLIAYFFEICSNPIYYDKLLYYKLVSKNRIDSANEIISNLNNYTNKVKTNVILDIGYQVGGNLLNRMWIPKRDLLDLINSYYINHFFGNYVIGIQIREYYIHENIDLNTFIDCALMIEENVKTSLKYNVKFKWFITSDSKSIIDKLISNHKMNKIIVVANGTIGHVELDKNAYQRALIDNELLSKCNEIIITGGSTFGNFFKITN